MHPPGQLRDAADGHCQGHHQRNQWQGIGYATSERSAGRARLTTEQEGDRQQRQPDRHVSLGQDLNPVQ